jgi:nucleotide-binding universal stress UspA family protein
MINRGPRSYVMAVDDSDLSTRGLDILLRILNPRDSLTCVHFYPSDNDLTTYQEMKTRIESDLEEFGPVNSSFELIEKERGTALTHCLVEYVERSECDIFAIAPRAAQSLSSLSEYVVNHVTCNVFLCKN